MEKETIEVVLMIIASVGLVGLVGYVSIKVKEMVAQLAPDAHLKPVKTVLIEGEVLDVIIDNLTVIPESG